MIQLKPKFFRGEESNPYSLQEDPAKWGFWYYERALCGDSELMDEFVARGIRLILLPKDYNYEGYEADRIPDAIRNFNAPLEEKGFVANVYSNIMGRNIMLLDEGGFGLNWLSYFYEDEH